MVSSGAIIMMSNLPQNSSFQLSTNDWIATLEAELFNFRAKKVTTGTIKMRAQKARAANKEEEDKEVAVARKRGMTIEEVIDKQANPALSTQKTSIPQPTVVTPEHPYRNAKDASYIPVGNSQVNPASALAAQKKHKPAYKTFPPIHDAKIAGDVYKRAMEVPITIMQQELLSLSPKVCSQVRDAMSTRRVQNKDATTAQAMMGIDDDKNSIYYLDVPMVPTFAVPNASHRTPPEGTTMIPDQFDIYYRSLCQGQRPDPDHIIQIHPCCHCQLHQERMHP